MNVGQSYSKLQRLPRKQLSELANAIDLIPRKVETQRMSEPKASLNRIKINKGKLPLDFFPKKDLSARRSSFKNGIPQEMTEPVAVRKVESERSNFTPEKTSFFGFLEEKEVQPFLHIYGGSKFMNRKF